MNEQDFINLGFAKNENGVFIKGKMKIGQEGDDFLKDIYTALYDRKKHKKFATIIELQEFYKECTGEYIYAPIKSTISVDECNIISKRGYLLN